MSRLEGSTWRMACLVVLAVVTVIFLTVGREPLNHFLNQLRQWGPVPFYMVFALSISLGVPPTPFLLAAGGAFDFNTNLIGIPISYACSLTIAYAYAQRLFKRQLEQFISAKAPHLAGLLRDNPRTTTLLVRLTPGFPYVLQNCLLVTTCRSFWGFLLPSLPPLVFLAMLYASMSKSLLAGKYGLLAVLLFVLGAVILAFRHVARRGAGQTAMMSSAMSASPSERRFPPERLMNRIRR
jgi:uncharacterized membrane protein YdjX (TVP38/TMEM64 family)